MIDIPNALTLTSNYVLIPGSTQNAMIEPEIRKNLLGG